MELCSTPHLKQKSIAMTSQNILTADVLDIVFENRNKAYGAYALRKYYDQRLTKSLIAALSVVTAFLLLSFQMNKKPLMNNSTEKGTVEIINLQPQQPEEKIPEEKRIEKPVEKPKAVESVKATDNIIIVPDNKVLPGDEVPEQAEMENKMVGTENSSGEQFTNQAVKTEDKNANKNNNGINGEDVIDVNNPILSPDEPPSYPGGIAALQNFLRRHLRTPDELETGQTASVKIKFIVGNEGEMYGYEVVQSAGDVFDNEVIRVLKKMPKWVPGKYRGQAVTTWFVIPVKFETVVE